MTAWWWNLWGILAQIEYTDNSCACLKHIILALQDEKFLINTFQKQNHFRLKLFFMWWFCISCNITRKFLTLNFPCTLLQAYEEAYFGQLPLDVGNLLTNMGIIYRWKHDLVKAEEMYQKYVTIIIVWCYPVFFLQSNWLTAIFR